MAVVRDVRPILAMRGTLLNCWSLELRLQYRGLPVIYAGPLPAIAWTAQQKHE